MLLSQRSQRRDVNCLDIQDKTNRVLNIILVAMLMIVLRLWHLTAIQYDQKVEEARKPRVRTVVEPAKRATIRDRFNLPLAINKIHYQAAILYSQLSEVPSVVWETNSSGKKIKRFKRREYISKLSQLLGNELQIDPERVEDLIYSKASLLYQVPFVLKEEISEREYYRLRALEKDWPGIQVQRVPRRYYPKGRIGADIIGYMGAINRNQYDAIISEMKILEVYLQNEGADGDQELPKGISSIPEARFRLKELQEHAYTINDYVGKSGIEGMYEEELRGFHGKKHYVSDARGTFLRELPGSREPIAGHRLLLSISSELQEYAEQLLVQNEQIREGKISTTEPGKVTPPLKQPWIKGGAIVAMDPMTGEVLTLASHPRFDPNDFISSGNSKLNQEKRSRILQWFENEQFLADVWDQKRPLLREMFDDATKLFYEEENVLKWSRYLDFILPYESAVNQAMGQISQLRHAAALQMAFEQFLAYTGQSNPYYAINRLYQEEEGHISYSQASSSESEIINYHFKANAKGIADMKKRLDPFLSNVKSAYDKVLVIDLCRMMVHAEAFSGDLMQIVGKQSIESYRETTVAMTMTLSILKQKAQKLFHATDFREWRKEYSKDYLKQKRKEEKLAKQYPKPYLDYFDAKENELFNEFWSRNSLELLASFILGPHYSEDPLLKPYCEAFSLARQDIMHSKEGLDVHYSILRRSLEGLSFPLAIQYLRTMRSFRELDRPLLGRYRHLRSHNGIQLEKDLAAAFYPVYGFGYGRSQAYRQAAIQGSIFKLVTAYEALRQRYHSLFGKEITMQKLNPLEIVDDVHSDPKGRSVGYWMDGSSIPRVYKGGRLPRSLASHNGKVDILRALEVSSNPYFSLLAGDVMSSPSDLVDAARAFSFGSRTGIDLPAEISGKVPNDVEENRTGLYSFAIGQHSLVVTPLQTAVMLSSIANGGKVFKPKIVSMTAGKGRKKGQESILRKRSFPFQESLALAGIDFPLFTAVDLREQEGLVNRVPEEVKREIFLPYIIRNMLLHAMQRVTLRTQTEGIAGLNRLYHKHPDALRTYSELKNELLGKTSTSEALENLNLDLAQGTCTCKHVWFGGIAFNLHRDPKDSSKKIFVSNDEFGQPELVVVIYLRFGSYGKEAAPLAAQIVKKWREIKMKYATN